MTDLTGKVALLTGAAKRIGAVIAETLHKEGCDVVIHYRSSAAPAEQLQTKLNAIRPNSCYLVQADLLEIDAIPDLIQQVIEQAGRLDILVNNASSFYPTPVGEITEGHWDDLLGSNLKAPLFLSQAATPSLRSAQGCIVNIVDIHAERPLKRHPVYSPAKAGLVMLTKALAKDLAPDIRVNGVAPGAIIWPEADGGDTPEEILSRTALKRKGTPEDIAKAVLFLIRDADYITGHIIPVDGGRLLNQ